MENSMRMERPMPEMPADLASAYHRANAVTEQYALQPESFIHEDESGTNRSIVENDLRYVADRKSRFEGTESDEYKLAKSLEAALFERVNNDKWFGERANMIMPSEYDDLANGIDGILEFYEMHGAKSYLGMAIDVTYNQDPTKKFDIVKEQIDEARLGTVKYFRSSDNTMEGRLKNLPRAVVALNAADATRIVRDWDGAVAGNPPVTRGVILKQLEMQLSVYQDYAKSLEVVDGKRYRVSQFYEGARRNIAALLHGAVRPEEMGTIDSHPSIKMIKEQLQKFQNAEATAA